MHDRRDKKIYSIIPENPDSKHQDAFNQLKEDIEIQKDHALENQANKRGDKKL